MPAKPKVAPSPPLDELARIPGAEPSAKLDAWWWLLVGVVALVVLLAAVRPAAAPELLRVCQAALAYLVDPPSKFEENREEAARIIIEAIRKAKGE